MLGVFGGTFNPIHLGHLRVAEEVAEALGLERMIFVPSARPPHKDDASAHEIAAAKLRLEWVELAIAGNPRFEVDRVEIDRPGPSYLVDTLATLAERHPACELAFALGRDAFEEMGSWRAPREIARLAHLIVLTRPPMGDADLARWLPSCLRGDLDVAADGRSALHREAETWIRVLPVTALDVSASDIRARVRQGRSIRYLVPEAVREAILASGAYAGPTMERRA